MFAKINTTRQLSLVVFFTCMLITSAPAQGFFHPGINQALQDLEYMKKMVATGVEPYKGAFERLKAADTNFIVRAYTHVLRGPYGKPNIGGDDLSRGANMAYNYAVLWYITRNKVYANKAIEIINAWSPVLWDLDYNDAKLLAAWTGHVFCNAAEILRYSNSGWQQKDIDSFTGMLMRVYYPLIRYYYPQANGNWDGAIIHTILAIAIFTDNRPMYNNAVDHFLHGPVNGSVFKYIYPSGQCQETMRDQGHVQLGLGEFAGAAQIAYTQGTDLFSIADHRVGLGFEYTAKILLGEAPHSYGKISERATTLRDDYEYVYRHYSAKGILFPYTKRAADSVRSKASRSILTSVRAAQMKAANTRVTPGASTIGYIAGARAKATGVPPGNAVILKPGESIQKALDGIAGTGGWLVLKAGVHTLPASLKIPAGITLSGEGLSTILFLDPASGERDALVAANDDLHDVTIRDLVIEGSTKTEVGTDPNSNRSFRAGPNRGGIIFKTSKEGQMKNITLANITVQNCTFNGVLVSGAANVTITGCDLNENGSNVIPGARLQHNLLLDHCSAITVQDSRLSTSPFGSGIAISNSTGATVTNCEIARNAYYGLLVQECKNITVKMNLLEANDRSGIMSEFLQHGSQGLNISGNIIRFNGGFGVETYSAGNSKVENNRYEGNGSNKQQQCLGMEKKVLMQ